MPLGPPPPSPRQALAVSSPPADKLLLPDFFALTDHWIRIELDAMGVYGYSGGELEATGIDLADTRDSSRRKLMGPCLHSLCPGPCRAG